MRVQVRRKGYGKLAPEERLQKWSNQLWGGTYRTSQQKLRKFSQVLKQKWGSFTVGTAVPLQIGGGYRTEVCRYGTVSIDGGVRNFLIHVPYINEGAVTKIYCSGAKSNRSSSGTLLSAQKRTDPHLLTECWSGSRRRNKCKICGFQFQTQN